MRRAWILTAAVFSGCGGTTPELYELLVDYFSLPDTCYSNGMQPSSVTTAAQPALMQVQVWDTPDNTAALQIELGGGSVPMGAAPSVPLEGIFTGKKVDKGWTFSGDNTRKQTLPGNNVITTTTHAEFSFERGPATFKGTAALSSSSNCVGNQCPGANPACSVSTIAVTGTRIAVNYERAP